MLAQRYASSILRSFSNGRTFHSSSFCRKKNEEEFDEDGEKVCRSFKVEKKKITDEYNYEYYKPFDCKKKPEKEEKRSANCWENRKALTDRKFCPVSHVIFNLDGVVLNTEEMIQKSHQKFLKRFNKKFTKDLRLRASGLSELDAATLIVDETDVPLQPEVYAHGTRQFLRTLIPSAKLIGGVYDLMCHLRANKIPIALASSSDERGFKLKSKCHPDVFNMFCHVTLRSDPGVKVGKPSPDIMLVSAKKFRKAPDNMTKFLAIEDSIAGAKAAKAAGMQVLMLTSRFVTEEVAKKVADMAISDLEDLDLTEFSLPNIPPGMHYS